MELGTFGALISFALTLEEKAVEVYTSLENSGSSSELNTLLRGTQKRLGRLKRIRQELVTEMILEPLSGVDSENYTIPVSPDLEEEELLALVIQIEENLHSFYSDTADLIPMKEAERAFHRLAEENLIRLSELKIISDGQ